MNTNYTVANVRFHLNRHPEANAAYVVATDPWGPMMITKEQHIRVLILATMILTALGGWVVEHAAHPGENLLDLRHIFSLMAVLSGVIGAWLGWVLDEWLGTEPWLFVAFFFLGLAAGMLNVYRISSKFLK